MKYDYAKFVYEQPIHFIRVEKEFLELANTKAFKEMIIKENGKGSILIFAKKLNGSYNSYSTFQIGFDENKIDKLPWVNKTWNN